MLSSLDGMNSEASMLACDCFPTSCRREVRTGIGILRGMQPEGRARRNTSAEEIGDG
jgi:hypothetical protein